MRWKILIILLFLLVQLIPVSQGYYRFTESEVWVDDDFTPSSPGWGITKFADIQSGIDGVSAGGTVWVNPGIYSSFEVNKTISIKGSNRANTIIDGNGVDEIVKLNADAVSLSGFNITNGTVGLSLYSDNNIIFLNEFSDEEFAIAFYNSDNNTIYWNDIHDVLVGVDMETESHDNLIHHNNFEVEWNGGWVDGDWGNRWNQSYSYDINTGNGNYWSDHWTWTDVYKGPNQDQPGSDGIVDESYDVSRDAIDYYPLMEKYTPPVDYPPQISNPTPSNNSVFVSINTNIVKIYIEDSDTFNWSIEGKYIVDAQGVNDVTGYKQATLITPLPYLTKITWYVNASDGIHTTSKTYFFITEAQQGGDTLQETIDNSDEYDVLLLPSATYNETIWINKTLTLIGANPTTTIIDGGGITNVIHVTADDVVIKGFTIQNSGSAGIYADGVENLEISNNIIINNTEGIALYNCKNALIQGNIIHNNYKGIYFEDTTNSRIINNNLSGEYSATPPFRKNGNNISICITGDASVDNTISSNTIWYNYQGILIFLAKYTTIYDNDLWRNYEGIEITGKDVSQYNTIDSNEVHQNTHWGIHLDSAIENYVSNNDIYLNDYQGIICQTSKKTKIGNNRIHTNYGNGIFLLNTYRTKIFKNNISGNENTGVLFSSCIGISIYANDFYGFSWDLGIDYQQYGVKGNAYFNLFPYLNYNLEKNYIYHNNFYNNKIQDILDSAPDWLNKYNLEYPNGGNYFENFHNNSQGAYDKKRGHYQTLPGKDGIVDTPVHVGTNTGMSIREDGSSSIEAKAISLDSEKHYLYTIVDGAGGNYLAILTDLDAKTVFSLEHTRDDGTYYDVDHDNTNIYVAMDSEIRAYHYDENSISLLDTESVDTPRRIFCYDNYIFVGCSNGLKIYTFEGGKFYLKTSKSGNFFKGLYYKNPYLYACVGTDGLKVYNFVNNVLTLIDSIDDGGDYQDIYSDGTYLYCGAGTAGIHVYSFDGIQLTKLNTYSDGENIKRVWYDGTYLFSMSDNTVKAFSYATGFTLIDTVSTTGYDITGEYRNPDDISYDWVYLASGMIKGIVLSDDDTCTDNYPLRNPWTEVELEAIDFTWSPEYPRTKETIKFTSLTEGREYYWDFGDGTQGKGEIVTHKYTNKGTYIVSLRVITNDGFEDATIKRLFVVPTGIFLPDPQPPKYPGFTVEEMYKLTHADKLKGSQNKIKIMVIDSGILKGTYNGFDLSYVHDKYAIGLNNGIDENGHGTWCNYAIGYILKQKLPNAEQISYKIFNSNGETSEDMLLQAFNEAKKLNVDIISFSGGAMGYPNDKFSKKVEELAKENGIIVVCASGNFGPYSSTILSPACSDYAFSISASDPQWYGEELTQARYYGILNLNDDQICDFSSRGPVKGIYPKPDVTAPGESILGPWVSKGKIIERAVSGTSMATPITAGGIAVVIAENKDLIERVKTLHFWDKSVVVIMLEDAIRESCYMKGGVNAWGAGIIQWDDVSTKYEAKLNQALFYTTVEIIITPLLLIILIILLWYIYNKRKGTWNSFKKTHKRWWS